MAKFYRTERLKRYRLIQQLFQQRQSLGAYPLRLFWSELPATTENDEPMPTGVQAAFSVPKKKFKRANKRNRIRRQVRELYRLHKHTLHEALQPHQKRVVCLWFYAGDTMPKYAELQSKLTYLIDKLIKTIC